MKTKHNLFKKYFFSNNEEIIKIIEYENAYTKETVAIAWELLEGRGIGRKLIRRIARDLMHKKLKTYLESFNSWNEKLKIPSSVFLTENEVHKIFEKEYYDLVARRNNFRANLNMYMG